MQKQFLFYRHYSIGASYLSIQYIGYLNLFSYSHTCVVNANKSILSFSLIAPFQCFCSFSLFVLFHFAQSTTRVACFIHATHRWYIVLIKPLTEKRFLNTVYVSGFIHLRSVSPPFNPYNLVWRWSGCDLSLPYWCSAPPFIFFWRAISRSTLSKHLCSELLSLLLLSGPIIPRGVSFFNIVCAGKPLLPTFTRNSQVLHPCAYLVDFHLVLRCTSLLGTMSSRWPAIYLPPWPKLLCLVESFSVNWGEDKLSLNVHPPRRDQAVCRIPLAPSVVSSVRPTLELLLHIKTFMLCRQ